MALPTAAGAATGATGLDLGSTLSAMDSMTSMGMAVTLQTAMDQLKMAMVSALANIMKTVGSDVEDASRKG
jgi:hypothetical protein